MKFGTLASHIIVLVAGLGIGYYITKPLPPATAVIPPQAPKQPWAIPSPGAGYAGKRHHLDKPLAPAAGAAITKAAGKPRHAWKGRHR